MGFTLIVPIYNQRNLRSSGQVAHQHLTMPAASTRSRRQLRPSSTPLLPAFPSTDAEGEADNVLIDRRGLRRRNKELNRRTENKMTRKSESKRHFKTDARGKYADYFSRLRANDRLVFRYVMLNCTKTEDRSMLPDDVHSQLLGLTNLVEPSRDGSWYIGLTQCSISSLGKDSKTDRHPQWQFSVADERKDGRLRKLIQAGLSQGATDGLIALANKVGTHKPEARIFVHFVAYAAKIGKSEDELPLIPNNKLTRGGGISHLCDQRGCIRQDHLEAVERHGDNIARRGCAGIDLMWGVNSRTILNERACTHSDKSGSLERQLRTSCQRIRLCPIDGEIERCFVQCCTTAPKVVSVMGRPRCTGIQTTTLSCGSKDSE